MSRNKLTLMIVSILLSCTALAAKEKAPATKILEDFQGFTEGVVPDKGWHTRNGKAMGVYAIAQEDENRFLQAEDQGRSVQFFREGGWNIREYPFLSWKWRVHEFPQGADERNGETNDSAAAIYVIFPNRFFIPEAIKYVWSENVPVDTKIVRNHRFPTIVIRSGVDKKGQWVVEHRNVVQDFVRHFGRRPGGTKALGFLTDANAVKGLAKADYDDFMILKKYPKEDLPKKPSETSKTSSLTEP